MTSVLLACILLLNACFYHGCFAQVQNSSALYISTTPASLGATRDQTCPAEDLIISKRETITREVKKAVQNIINPLLGDRYGPSHICGGGVGGWTRMAYLNMTDSNQQCPTNWTLRTNSVRGCGRTSTSSYSCDSAFFSQSYQPYSQVCGRVIAYQRGHPDAFFGSFLSHNTLDDAYSAGVLLTHGSAGSRQHIWTFSAALFKQSDMNYISTFSRNICPCTSPAYSWTHQIPSFIGNNYFCDSGNPGPSYDSTTVYSNDPLWDGEGCPSSNTCCQFNNPPWFTTSLPVLTSDALEVRLCNVDGASGEDVIVTLVDIYVKNN